MKTSWKRVWSWPLGKYYKTEASKTHVYVFVNLRGEEKPNYYIVRSQTVADEGRTYPRRKGTWYGFKRGKLKENDWSVFGLPQSN